MLYLSAWVCFLFQLLLMFTLQSNRDDFPYGRVWLSSWLSSIPVPATMGFSLKGRETEKIFHCWFILQLASRVGAGPCWRQEPGTPSVSCTAVWDSSTRPSAAAAFLGSLAGSWFESRAAGTWTHPPIWECRLWLNLLCPKASPSWLLSA